MDERPNLPNFDPKFCLTAAIWSSTTCAIWLISELLILTLVDPNKGRCPGWTIHAENGQGQSLWFFVVMFTAFPTFWICFVVLRWQRFSQMVFDSAADDYQPFMTPKFIYDQYKPNPITFPHNAVFVAVCIGWSLFCTGPLWLMLANCAGPPG